MKYNCILLVLLLYLNYRTNLASRTNFEVKSFRLCNDTQGLFTFNGNFSKQNNNYYIDGFAIITLPLDENIGVTFKIESKVNKNHYMELFTIREKYFCKACNIYMGEFWYDIQRSAQVIPGKCPMPARKYEVHHALVDFNRVALQTFPFGILRFTLKLVHNKNLYHNIICLQGIAENIPDI